MNTYLAIENNGSGGRGVLEDGKDLVENLFLRSLILSEWNTKGLNFADLLGKVFYYYLIICRCQNNNTFDLMYRCFEIVVIVSIFEKARESLDLQY